jgi:23S rRNA pseudouridine1911/1915/1917 synthase
MIETIIASQDQKVRLDHWLVKNDPSQSRARWQQLIDQGFVLVNHLPTKASYRLSVGDHVQILPAPILDVGVKAEPLPLVVVYEDKDIIVINKPQGMVVHPAPGHPSKTLVNALLFHVKDLSCIGGEKRPGIVHRLDKDTSGLIVVAKHDQAHHHLADQLKAHTMKRDYQALVRGVIKENKGTIIAPIGRDPDDRVMMDVIAEGKPAETSFTVMERFSKHTLIHCKLKTGRTHQIRVHLNFIHHPIESDPLYLPQKHPLHKGGQLLHAFQLTLVHPRTEKVMTFNAPIPEYFQAIINKLRV